MFTFIKNLFKNNKKQVESSTKSSTKLTRIVRNELGEFGVQERNQFNTDFWSWIIYHWYPTRGEAERKQINIEKNLILAINKSTFKEV